MRERIEMQGLTLWTYPPSSTAYKRGGTLSILTKKKYFAERMLKQIAEIKLKIPSIDLSIEEDYFLKMRNV